MSNKTLAIIAGVVVLAFVYWKFFHKKRGMVGHGPAGTPAVKKKGGGGWRHRFSSLAKKIPGSGIATGLADKYVGGMTGGMLHLSDVGKMAGM